MKTSRVLLSGLAITAMAALALTARKRNSATLIRNRAITNQSSDGLEERCDEAENRFTSAMQDFIGRLSSLQELHQRSSSSFDEGRRLVSAELRRLRILVTWTLILSCFGVVSFAIVLFLAYIKY
jgi:hypothetical protein